MQGEQFHQAAEALRRGDLEGADVTPEERSLLRLVEKITKHAYRVTEEDIEDLKGQGWSEAQIAEAVYDTALFNLFVRLADSFGIEPPPLYEPEGAPAAADPASYSH